MLDLVIRGGTVVDGTGKPARRADVGIHGGRIVEIGDLGTRAAADVLEARDYTVLPGFVDIHTHSDLSLLSDGRARSAIGQGVTTEIVGNCGLGVFPCGRGRVRDVIREAVSLIDVDPAVTWDWEDVTGYRRAVEDSRPSVNVVALTGHIPLRLVAAMDSRGPLGQSATRRMADLLGEALDAGAAGLSTGLMYPPAIDADLDELVALGHVVATHDRLFSVHMRNYSDSLDAAVVEALSIAEATGCRLQISHLAVAGRRNWGGVVSALDRIDAGRARGLDVAIDLYPYLAGSANLSQIVPTWAQAGGAQALLARLQDPADRLRIRREWEASLFLGWDEIEISWVGPELADVLGLDIAEIGRRWGADPAEAALDLIALSENRAAMVAYGRSEKDMLAALSHPAAMIGSDGLALDPSGPSGAGRPHPRSYGCFPRLMGPLVRRGVIEFERAVQLCTSVPADRVGLGDRGRIAPGAVADVVVLDPAVVADTATFQQPAQFPVGIEAVIVSGAVVVKAGTQRDDVRRGSFLSTFR